jgi:hypothetical protein
VFLPGSEADMAYAYPLISDNKAQDVPIGARRSYEQTYLERVLCTVLGGELWIPATGVVLARPGHLGAWVAPAYGRSGSITIQPRPRSSAASSSVGMWPRSCSWAECRHP